jgi:hypothetical protein
MLGRLAVVRVIVGLRLVLMAMVAEVRHLVLFVLAIDGRHRPGVLDRQNSQQQNEQDFFHPAIVAARRAISFSASAIIFLAGSAASAVA